MKELIKSIKNHFLKNILDTAKLDRAAQELEILNYNLHDALQFLKKNYKKYYKLPLYLLMGPSSFGKTTLISHSGLNLIGAHGNNIVNPNISTKYCEWWFDNDAVYLDTAGIYFKSDQENPHANLVWMGFLRSLKRRYLSNHIAGILIVMDLPAIIDSKEKLIKTLSDVQERVYELAKYVNKLPIYLVFTKCDLLAGFNEFFADLNQDEQIQTFGITFAKHENSIDPIRTFNTEFDKLLKKLNYKLLKLLHNESQLKKRALLKNFLLQFANLRKMIMEIVNEIPKGAHIKFNGVYFTSSLQQGIPKDYINIPCINPAAAPIKKLDEISALKDNRSYFIGDLFKKVINKKPNIAVTEISWPQFATTITLTALIIIGSISWYIGYNKSLTNIKTTQTYLQNYEQTNDLNQLQTAVEKLSAAQNSWWAHLGLNQVNKTNALLQKTYYNIIASTFIPQLQKTLETEITISNRKEHAELYNTLKTYLMLSTPKKLNKPFVSNWFNNYWAKSFANSPAKRQQLAMQLQIALNQGISIKPQRQIITTAREALNSDNIATKKSVYNNLKNLYKNQNIILKFTDQEIKISKMYTTENFGTIYQKQIAETANTLSHKKSDWVTENNEQQKLSKLEIQKLIASVRANYIKDYVDTWSNALQTVKIAEFANINQAATTLRNIADTDYPLLPLLKMIQVNTSLTNAPKEFTAIAATKFQDLNSINLKALDSCFANLANYFSDIVNNSDPNKAAFLATATRFQNPNAQDALSTFETMIAKQPEPLRSWMQNIANNSWKTLIATTQNYLDSVWTSSVFPSYQKNLENHYPLFKNATQSTTLDDFTKFFGPNGAIDNFFKYYLKPFVDTNRVYWVWKKVDGEQLSIPQSTLEIFIRAALIQKMFYPDNAAFNVRFALTPIAISPNARNFELNIDGQNITYKYGQKKTDHLVWPGPTANQVTMAFINNQGQKITTNITNDAWAWFRLLDKSNLHIITSPRQYSLVFDLNGNAIKYKLTAEQAINPFIPEILDNFRCPEKL